MNDFEEIGRNPHHKRAQTSGQVNMIGVHDSLNSSFGGQNKIPLMKDNQNQSRFSSRVNSGVQK